MLIKLGTINLFSVNNFDPIEVGFYVYIVNWIESNIRSQLN